MAETAEAVCCHHWLLGEPSNEVVLGVCKYCHATKEYPATLEATERFDDYVELFNQGKPQLSTIINLLDQV